MKDIKDYLPYYLGCDYWTNNSQGNLNAKTLPDVIDMCKRNKGVQLHLRRLSDMTEEENTEWKKLRHAVTDGFHAVLSLIDTPDSFHYLLKQGFDLFGLIDAGLAIDVKTITPAPGYH